MRRTEPARRSARAIAFSIALVAGAASLAPATSARAGDATEERGQRLASLRAEVEELSTALEDRRADSRARLRALRGQQADLEARRSGEQIRQAQADARLAELRAAALSTGRDEELLAALRTGAAALGAAIGAGLPFRVSDRLAAVQDPVAQATAGELSPERAVARLWGLVEDELRIAGEVALHQQSIELPEGPHLVEVAHLGFAALYFKTRDGRYGMAVHGPDGWSFEELDGQKDRRALDDLFGSLRKGVREGWFALPAVPQPTGGAS